MTTSARRHQTRAKATPGAKAKAKPATKAKPAAARGRATTPRPTPATPGSAPKPTTSWASDAYGLTRLRSGFGKTPEDDTLFALGYPHVVVATDAAEPAGWRDPRKYWKVFARQTTTHVPRTALPWVYACHVRPTQVAEIFAGPTPEIDLATEASKLFWRDDRVLYFLEAMFGSEAVATAAVDVLCKFRVKAWSSDELDRSGWNGIHNLGFVLLRVSPATRKTLVARLEKVFNQVAKAQGKEWWRPLQALDIVLHGRIGYERSEGGWADLALVADDPAWVGKVALATLKRMKPTDRARFDSQIAFLGGASVVKEMRNVKRFFSEHHADAKRQLERIQ